MPAERGRPTELSVAAATVAHMSESEPTGENVPDEPVDAEDPDLTPTTDVRHLAPSSELQMVVSLVMRDKDNRIPLTLTTTSGVIIGVAVHPTVWYREMAEHTRGLGDGAARLAELFDVLAEEWAARYDGADLTRLTPNIGFAYLVDAAIFPLGGTGEITIGNPRPWNVHLRHVAAWSLGMPGQHQA